MSQILISKYKTGVDFPPLRTGLTHLAGENNLTFPYKTGDAQDSFSNDSGVHLCMINAGSLMLTDDTDTFEVTFGASDISITWYSQRHSLRDIDDVVFVFNAFAKPVSGMSKLIYTGSAGQTVFTGNDDAGTALAFQNESVMVFVNDKFQDTSDFTTSGGNTVTLGASATAVSAGDKVSIIVFDSVINQTSLANQVSQANTAATGASNHKTTAQRWATEADTTTVVDADTNTNYNEYSAKAYAQGTGTPNGSAKEWATKTGSAVVGTEFSAKYWATSPAVTTVSSNITEITTVHTNINAVNSVHTNISDVTAVAGQISNNNLQTLAADIADVQTVASDLQETTSEIDTVANAITNVDNVGNNIGDVTTVAGQIAPTNNISTVAGAATAITSVHTNIGAVNTVNANIGDVQTVAGIASDVSTAATNVTQFNETYHGPSASAPTSNVTTGDLWFDTTNNTMKVYNGTGWINSGSSVNGTSERVSYIVGTNSGSYTSGSTTVFPVIYDAGFVDVYLRGIKLVNGSDFTATNGTTITLSSAAVAGDPIDIVAYGTFQLSNTALSDLTDVNVSSPTNNQILQYNSTNSRFENADLSAASPGFALAMSVALG